MRTRESCAGCGHELTTFLDLGKTPLANTFPLPDEPDGPSFPLQLAVCGPGGMTCGLVQQRCIPDMASVFGERYGFATSSPAAAMWAKETAAWCTARAPAFRDGALAVDVGCNDGTLLGALGKAGRVAGIEPSAAALMAREAGFTVDRRFLSREVGKAFAEKHGKAALVTAFHVAAHVADPDDFLAGIGALMAPDGVAVVEFQSLADMITGGMWDLAYHEHQFHYSLTTFSRLAAAHKLRVCEVTPTPAQGGSLRVVLRKTWDPQPAEERWKAAEAFLHDPGAYAGFQGRAEHSARRINDVLGDEAAEGRTVAGYAASAKACTLLNFCGINRHDLPYVADTTRGKNGREIPGCRIPIHAEQLDRMPDTYLLLAANHLRAVLTGMPPWWRIAGGRLITPLPLPVVV